MIKKSWSLSRCHLFRGVAVILIVVQGISFQGVRAQEKSKDPATQLRKEYQEKVIEFEASPKDLNARYLLELKKIEEAAKSAGELKKLLAIREEIKVFSDGGTKPSEMYDDLKNLQKIYLKQLQIFRESILVKQTGVRDEYIEKLKALRSALTKQDKIEAAIAIQTEIDGFGDGLGSLAPRKPKKIGSTEPVPKPQNADPAMKKPETEKAKLTEQVASNTSRKGGKLRVWGTIQEESYKPETYTKAPQPPANLPADVIQVGGSMSMWVALREDGTLVGSRKVVNLDKAVDIESISNVTPWNGFAALTKRDEIKLIGRPLGFFGNLSREAEKTLDRVRADYVFSDNPLLGWIERGGQTYFWTDQLVKDGVKPVPGPNGGFVECVVAGFMDSAKKRTAVGAFRSADGSVQFASNNTDYENLVWPAEYGPVSSLLKFGDTILFQLETGRVASLSPKTLQKNPDKLWGKNYLGNTCQRLFGSGHGLIYQDLNGGWIFKSITNDGAKHDADVSAVLGGWKDKEILDVAFYCDSDSALLVWIESPVD